MSDKSAEYVEFYMEFHRETEKAILVSDVDEYWIPKSQLQDGYELDGNMVVFSIPEWLALDKEMI